MSRPARYGYRRRRSGIRALWPVVLVLALPACHTTPGPPGTPSVRTGSAARSLQRDIDTILAVPAFERASWGILVRSLTADDTLYGLNAARLFMPASSLKLVTLAAAAERLGWNYSYETTIGTDGTVRGDTLDGNLIVVASGDPGLDRPALESWTEQLKRLGIVKVLGTVRADDRAFAGEGLGAGWSWDDVPYYYAAPIAAAQFHENAVEVTLKPGPSPGTPAIFELAPAGSGLQVENRLVTGAATAPAEFVARRAPGSPSVVIEGVVPSGSGPIVHGLSVPDPPRFLAAAFSATLAAGGVSLGDREVTATPGRERPLVLITHHSLPLFALARRLMEVSQNQYAETLIKSVGAKDGTPTFEGGLKAVESVLKAWGIGAEGAILRDGSGLSRYDYIAPETLVQVLAHMYKDPVHNASFFASFNVAGRTGTLAARLTNTAAAGNARAKDGSMAGVRSLCGVVRTKDGEPLAFAILANNFAVPGPTVTDAIDAIVARLADFKR